MNRPSTNHTGPRQSRLTSPPPSLGAAPQRHCDTRDGTRLPQLGQTHGKPAWPAFAVTSEPSTGLKAVGLSLVSSGSAMPESPGDDRSESSCQATGATSSAFLGQSLEHLDGRRAYGADDGQYVQVDNWPENRAFRWLPTCHRPSAPHPAPVPAWGRYAHHTAPGPAHTASRRTGQYYRLRRGLHVAPGGPGPHEAAAGRPGDGVRLAYLPWNVPTPHARHRGVKASLKGPPFPSQEGSGARPASRPVPSPPRPARRSSGRSRPPTSPRTARPERPRRARHW
jgi:hypothetical protein